MLSVQVNADTIGIVYQGRELFRLGGQFPLFLLGKGHTRFKMQRGSFSVKNKTSHKTALCLQQAEPHGDGWRLTLADKTGGICLQAQLSVEDNRLRLRFPAPPQGYNRLWLRLPAAQDEHIYGCGENFTRFDLRGETAQIWVQEHNNVKKIIMKGLKEKLFGSKPQRMTPFKTQQSYCVQPTFLSSRKYFVHVHSAAYMRFDFEHAAYHELMLSDFPEISIGCGASFDDVLENLTALLGRQPLLPDWAWDGAILGIQGGTQAVEDKLARVQAAGMRVCGVWCQDWQGARVTAVGKQLMWNWEWDQERYPDLDKKMPVWRSEGVRFLGYINPFLATEKPLYQYASRCGYCVKTREGADYLVKSTTFPAAMVDLSNPAACDWIKGIIKENMIAFGLDGWMADFGEYLPTDCLLHSGEDPAAVHNAWPAIWARLNREAVEESGRLGEILFFTRAGFTGSARQSVMMWNGDQYTDWTFDGGMPSVMPGTLSLAACGYGLVHSDVGGFSSFMHVKRDGELMVRWAEMNAFSPLLRSHESIRPDENAQFDADETVLAHYARISRIHAALKPYLKDAQLQNHRHGLPMIRPLFFYYEAPRDFTECYEYLLGRDFLVAPVLEQGAHTREVYLPDDAWVHIWTGKQYSGGTHTIPAPLGQPPVFCRKESTWRALAQEIGDIT